MGKFAIKKTLKIKAPQENVWDILLTPEMFAKWSDVFSPGSHMKGEWKKGGVVTYLDNTGMGLKAKVVDLQPHNRASVEYIHILKDFKEDPSQEEGWVGCRETYLLTGDNGMTNLMIESEVPTQKYYEEFNKMWDKALIKIKELAEG